MSLASRGLSAKAKVEGSTLSFDLHLFWHYTIAGFASATWETLYANVSFTFPRRGDLVPICVPFVFIVLIIITITFSL